MKLDEVRESIRDGNIGKGELIVTLFKQWKSPSEKSRN